MNSSIYIKKVKIILFLGEEADHPNPHSKFNQVMICQAFNLHFNSNIFTY